MNRLSELIETCHWMNKNQFSPATSGNYSLRIDDELIWVSASGVDKGNIRESDFIEMNIDGSYTHETLRPSDEALIHTKIFEMDKNAQCVLHAHSIASTALSTFLSDSEFIFTGLELQKAFTKIQSHEEIVKIPIFENTQDIKTFSSDLGKNWMSNFDKVPCLVLRGHGIYVWGESIQKTKRFLEGVEFLIAVKIEHIKMGLK